MLCGEPLNKYPTNREHFLPQVLIRNFKKLKVPSAYTHALRIDLEKEEGEAVLAPISCHKDWAVVVVHEKCNLDASPMCQDLKFIIDHLNSYPKEKEKRILEYYSHIWKMPVEELGIRIIPDDELKRWYSSGDISLIYEPGYLWVGKIIIGATSEIRKLDDCEMHSIYLGPKDDLEAILN